MSRNITRGLLLWAKRYDGTGNGLDIPTSVVVSPGRGQGVRDRDIGP